jgi:hypothetical protein
MSDLPHSGTVGHRACSFEIEAMAHTIYQNMHNPFPSVVPAQAIHIERQH